MASGLVVTALAGLRDESVFLANAFVDDDTFDGVHEWTSPINPPSKHGASRHIGCHAVSMSSTLRHCVLGGLHRACPDDFPSRLRFEYRRFLCEGIDAFPRLGGGLLDDNEFGESGDEEGSRFLEFLVANFGERLDDALDVLARHIAWMLLSDFLNEFRLRHQLGHVTPCFRIALGGTTLTSNLQWRELGGWLPPTAASSRI